MIDASVIPPLTGWVLRHGGGILVGGVASGASFVAVESTPGLDNLIPNWIQYPIIGLVFLVSFYTIGIINRGINASEKRADTEADARAKAEDMLEKVRTAAEERLEKTQERNDELRAELRQAFKIIAEQEHEMRLMQETNLALENRKD